MSAELAAETATKRADLGHDAKPAPDVEEIRRALAVLHEADAIIELRAIHKGGKKRIDAGYFDSEHREALIRHAAKLNQAGNAVYVNLNPLDPQLLARAANRVQDYAGTTAMDVNVTRRRWVLIDVDPVRPKDTSATSAQLDAALERCQAVKDFLTRLGWPVPVSADSGNGGHLLYRVELPNDATSRDLVKRCLKALAARFDDGTVTVDCSVFNAARIIKLHGTVATKGDHVPGAPWRLSRLRTVPQAVRPVPDALLQELAREAEGQTRPQRERPRVIPARGWTESDVDAFLERGGIESTRAELHDGVLRWKLQRCPFNVEHGFGESAVFLMQDGRLGFRCFHNGCQDRQWNDLRELVDGPREGRTTEDREPAAARSELPPIEAYDDEARLEREAIQAEANEADAQSAGEHAEAPLREVTMADFATAELPPTRFVIEPLLPRGYVTLLSGHGDAGKTLLALTIAAHVACGARFADLSCTTGRVLFVSLEDSGALIRLRLKRICAAYGFDVEAVAQRITVFEAGEDEDAPLATEYSEGGARRLVLTTAFEQLRTIAAGHDLIVIDNASDAFDANENERRFVRRFVRALQRVGRDNDAAVWLLSHVDKAGARYGTAGNSYSGSTAWHNSTRSRMALAETDRGLELTHEKSNLAKKLEQGIALNRGEYGVPMALTRAQREQHEGADAGAVLAAIQNAEAAGIKVPTAMTGPSNAALILATRPGLPEDLARDSRRIRAALVALEREGRIVREPYRDCRRHERQRFKCAGS